MMERGYDVRELFSETANDKISRIDYRPIRTLDDFLKAQEGSDKSYKLHAILESWEYQTSEERKLRRLYAVCFICILVLQIIFMNILFVIIGCGFLNITEKQFSVFYVSVFGEITAFVLIVTRYLFRQNNDRIAEVLRDL